MLKDGASLDGTCGRCSLVYRDGIIYEKLDPHSGKNRRRWAARAVVGRLVGQEEFRAVNGKTGDDLAAGIQVPQEFRAEGGLVEFYGGVSVPCRQHGENLRPGFGLRQRSPWNRWGPNPNAY